MRKSTYKRLLVTCPSLIGKLELKMEVSGLLKEGSTHIKQLRASSLKTEVKRQILLDSV